MYARRLRVCSVARARDPPRRATFDSRRCSRRRLPKACQEKWQQDLQSPREPLREHARRKVDTRHDETLGELRPNTSCLEYSLDLSVGRDTLAPEMIYLLRGRNRS